MAGLKPPLQPIVQKTGLARQMRHAGCPAGRNRRQFRGHVVDEEAEDAGLRRYVKELRRYRQHEMPVRPDGVGNALGRIVQVIIVFGLDIGNVGEEENRRDHQHHQSHAHVGDIQRLAAGAVAGGVLGVEIHAAHDRPADPSDAVGRLRQVDARGGKALIAQHGGVRVGDGL